MSYESALQYIHSVSWLGSRPGLSRTRELLAAMGDPHKKLKFVHVAGTNGKGSACACIASILREAGYRTGLYISPYVIRFNERIQVNGEYISDEDLEEIVDEIRPLADKMSDTPTEFELITAIGMRYFEKKRCDIVVLEVGLGGEMDSTNVIDAPEVAVIASIGLDHTAELGGTIEEIARAKAGIIKPGCTAVFYGENDTAEAVLKGICAEKGVPLTKPDFSLLHISRTGVEGSIFDFGKYKGISLPLAGTYQPKNAALAVTAAELLAGRGYEIPENAITAGLSKVSWPGRFETLMREPMFILDGAHNPHAAISAAESFKEYFGEKKITFIVGVMKDKDIDSFIDIINPYAAGYITVAPSVPRAMAADALAQRIESRTGLAAEPFGDMDTAVKRGIDLAGADGVICAIGSLYMSTDVRRAVKKLNG